MGPTGRHAVFQVHPSRRCNLRCRHCYSASGPEVAETLPLELLLQAVREASLEGYSLLGVSGGEPLLYPHLSELLESGHAHGMATTVTSNGMLLGKERLRRLVGQTDLLAISLDGVPDSHDRLRGSSRAFEGMRKNLEAVRDSGIPFGFIFTLTQHNVNELDWVTDFALEQGAQLLKIHPPKLVGRAQTELPGAAPDELEAAFAVIQAARAQARAGGRLYVQLDVLSQEVLRAHPDQVFAGSVPPDIEARLAELVSPLVLENDGTLSPLDFGFPRAFALGNLNQASLKELAAAWKGARLADFRALCHRTYRTLMDAPARPFLNWYEAVNREARAVG